ncbi:RrF2 family transcriptional regulator [Rhabdothermincola sp.]|uniref:RrF2 family transcriptional regulator n=1 Tax=Rhabdothermincola sp. TaxID=2820405 RepID=UPI002FDFEEA2
MRLEITRRADLATRALLTLGEARGRLKAAELAARVGASPGFLAQAMTPLVSRGWVRSDPGPTGGYTLVTDLDALSVLEVIEAVEGPTDTAGCVLEDRPCSRGGHCALHIPWSRARTLLLQELSDTTLAGVAGRGPR